MEGVCGGGGSCACGLRMGADFERDENWVSCARYRFLGTIAVLNSGVYDAWGKKIQNYFSIHFMCSLVSEKKLILQIGVR